jgi:cytochrome c
MPQAVPGSLPADDVYSLTAFILHLNGLLPAEGALDRESLPRIEMPARDRFVYDDRRGGPELR